MPGMTDGALAPPPRQKHDQRMRKLTGLLLAATVACLALVACNDQGGHGYTALNQSDSDVIVEVVTDSRRVVRLPAHTRGNLSSGWSGPLEGWRFTVKDTSCAELISFSLKDQPAGVTLWVNAAGNIVLGQSSVFSFEGKDVRLVSELASADCS